MHVSHVLILGVVWHHMNAVRKVAPTLSFLIRGRRHKRMVIADLWYFDDGDILCDPRLVLHTLACFDTANTRAGADKNLMESELIYYATESQLIENSNAWRMDDVKHQALVKTV